MVEKKTMKQAAGTSDEAVRAKTGRGWEEWFAILDAAGAMEMEHKDIASYLHEQHGVPGWWTQMVSNGYEQERKGRGRHQMPDGYQISKSKTVSVPLAQLYTAWEDEGQRTRWLGESGLHVRKASPEKSMRITWIDGKSSLEVLFSAKSEERSQVNVQHSKLPDAEEAERMKSYWGAALERMQALLEG